MSRTHPLYVQVTVASALLVVATVAATRAFATGTGVVATGAALVVLAGALALAFARRVSRPLEQLANEAEAVRRLDFSDYPVVRSGVREIDQLAHGFDLMRDGIRRFIALNDRLAGERDLERLLPWLLEELAGVARARAGVLYLLDARAECLVPAAFRTEAGTALPEALSPLSMDASPALLAEALASGAASVGRLDADAMIAMGLETTLEPLDAIALPLLNRQDQPVGLLLLFAEERPDAARLAFVSAISASAVLTLETRELMASQKALLQAVIRMVAGAIDAQSPYTGGHCERVPELTIMLARAACEASDGPFASFALDPDEWEAVHIAAWLHDCGKVTTPEYVVDKATKLETIHDRIHEIRMRFEVLKRDADIAYWRGLARGGDEPALRAERDAAWSRLDEEFAFVASCNTGGEYLSPECQQRLCRIGAQRWWRTLDDRLGLSRDELARRPQDAATLPAEEHLLADKPEHRIPRPAGEGLEPGNPWGFRMDVPELLYNRGELHNLTVSRGTLSAEERYKINEHIVQTIIMLTQLPLPRHLQAVPEIAGGHHEKMDGTGYPRGLRREEMSPVARMMAIADIFEALTAADRPYKPGKTLSQALTIMAKMREEQHIDPDLFELFLRSGVYREYAGRFMRAEQVDDVMIDDYLPSA
ncbi:MAG TPA: HD domain-containing phosphohydrolase [Lysobacter sp.]|nr:HD domain-containing phosphohydrolase [Lysobacter sp.]